MPILRFSTGTYATVETGCELLHQIAAAGLTTPITLVLNNVAKWSEPWLGNWASNSCSYRRTLRTSTSSSG